MIAGWGENFMLPELFAGVLLLALTAIALNEAIRFLEKRWTVWQA
jgi:NitT/TauT family transport system permease protein